jgi:hypothetical protein
MSGNRKYILILLGCFLLLSLAEYLTPKAIDWRVSLSKDEKIPYGNLIMRQLLAQQLGGQPISDNFSTFYELANADRESDTVALPKNFVLINNGFTPDSLDTKALLNYAYSGSTVFIAANWFGGALADTLHLSVLDNMLLQNKGVVKELLDSLGANFNHPKLRADKPYFYRRGTVPQYFGGADTSAVVLGTNSLNAANFIRIPFGEGSFLLHCNPLIFTNYNMLYGHNAEYIAKAFSYLPAQPTVWDEYYKGGREKSSSPFRFLLENEALAWGWRLLLGATVLYVAFAIKRRQRVIPIVHPPLNTTLEFARTIGRLYYLHKDHQDLARKKTAYFMELLRTHFYLSTSGVYPFGPATVDQLGDLAERVAFKTNVPLPKVKALFDAMLTADRNEQMTENQLIALNGLIEEFYEATGLVNRG